MMILLGELGGQVSIQADSDGFGFLPLSEWRLEDRSTWPASILMDPKGPLLAQTIETLLELGLTETRGSGVWVPWNHWDELVKLGLEFPRHWLPWNPFLLRIDSTGSLGRDDFEYRYQFLLGTQEVLIQRTGAIVQRAHHEGRYLLDPQAFFLVEAMDRFNALPPEERKGAEAWIRFAEVKGCAMGIGAQLDEFLRTNEVVIPSKIGITVVERADGGLLFLPRCDGVPKEAFERAFLRSRDGDNLFHLDGEDGRKVRLILTPGHTDVLQRMRRVRGLRGSGAEALRRAPERAFEGLFDHLQITYSRRVEGIGDWRPLPTPKAPSGVSMLELDGLELGSDWDPDAEAEALGFEQFKVPVTIEHQDPSSGKTQRIVIESQPEARAFVHANEAAHHEGSKEFIYEGKTWPVDPTLGGALRRGNGSEEAKGQKKFLLIYTDEEEVKVLDVQEAGQAVGDAEKQWSYDPPSKLSDEFKLKAHQEEAVAWLQGISSFAPKRRGSLLADEMGLGKTLEVLAFLAWIMEKGLFDGLHTGPPPYRPVLVIAPLMLIENQTWQSDMAKFFAPGTFDPVLNLHGGALKARKLASGRETEIGRPLLDAEDLIQHRVVLTNYETITNYQHSFAQLRGGRSIWSVVVTDEAQEFKNPQSRISHAIKALHPDFHIACTGTPVENRLLDLWNLFDALQPSLLGAAKDFKATYETPTGGPDASKALGQLRERLRYQKPSAFLLRREKTILQGFPKKRVLPIRCEMTARDVDRHLRLIKALKQAQSKKGIHLSYLHRLAAIYQHPLMFREDFDTIPVQELIEASPKLQGVLKCLSEIEANGEKVLLFARHIKIQHMLARVIEAQFGIPVSIINGESQGEAGTTSDRNVRGRLYRAKALERFRARSGFNAMVLSPFVAGVGLTITEANHVIHFGRWWNPAVESQATDRIYRIGQEKDVQVHLPILHDPTGRLPKSFDQKLDELLQSKESLARDFLQPRPTQDDLADELCQELIRDQPEDSSVPDCLELDDCFALPRLLFESLAAVVFEQNGFQVELGEPRASGELAAIARKARETVLVQCCWSREKNAQIAELDALVGLQWRPAPTRKVFLLGGTTELKAALPPGIEVWSARNLWEMVQSPIQEPQLMERGENRVPLRPS